MMNNTGIYKPYSNYDNLWLDIQNEDLRTKFGSTVIRRAIKLSNNSKIKNCLDIYKDREDVEIKATMENTSIYLELKDYYSDEIIAISKVKVPKRFYKKVLKDVISNLTSIEKIIYQIST